MSATVFTLRIFFYGVIGFVPNTDRTALWALMLDAHVPSTASPCADQRHDPRLGFAGTLVSCSGNCGMTPSQAWTCPADGWWQLASESIAVVADGDEELRVPGGRVGLPSSVDDLTSFGWTAQMASVSAKAGQIDRDLLEPKVEAGRLAGRINLEKGAIESCRLVGSPRTVPHDQDHHIPLMRFQSNLGESVQVQALAEVVVLTRKITSEYLILELSSLQTNLPTRTIKLKPLTCGAEKCLDLFISNEPVFTNAHLEGFCRYFHEPARLLASLHFPLFYDVSQLSRTPWSDRFSPLHIEGDRRSRFLTKQMCGSPLKNGCIPGFDSTSGSGPSNRPICTVATFAPTD